MEISSSEETMPAFFNARACARLAAISYASSLRSNSNDLCQRSKPGSSGWRKRPAHIFISNLRAGAGARTRRQAQNANEAFCILLVIAVAHGERRQVGAIQRVLRFTADDRNVSFV